MTDSEIYNNKFSILFECLEIGMPIDYKLGWTIYFFNGEILQVFQNKKNGKEIIHKSGITLSDFVNFISKMDIKTIKIYYANIRLYKLQEKMMRENEE